MTRRPDAVHRRRGDRHRQAGWACRSTSRARRRQPFGRLDELNAGSSGRRRRCTGSTAIRRAACCSPAIQGARVFQRAFESRRSKRPISRCSTAWSERRGDDRPGARQDLQRRKRAGGWSATGGQPAVTHWRVVEVRDGRAVIVFTRRPAAPIRSASTRARHRHPHLGDPVYGAGSGPMLLHALAAGRPARAQAAGRRDRAAAGPFGRVRRRCEPEDVDHSRRGAVEKFPRRDRPGRPERQQGGDRRASCARRVQARSARLTSTSGSKRSPGAG